MVYIWKIKTIVSDCLIFRKSEVNHLKNIVFNEFTSDFNELKHLPSLLFHKF